MVAEVARSGKIAESGVTLIAAAQTAIATAEGALEKAQSKATASTPFGADEYADPGYQSDGKKRYPIDTERHIRAAWNFIHRPNNARRYTAVQLDDIKAKIIAAWKAKIDTDGPPAADGSNKARKNPAQVALTKALWDVGHVARIILDLDWLEESLAAEAAMEGDDLPQPARLQAIIAELCGFLNALVTEETGEILDGAESDSEPAGSSPPDILIMAAGAAGAALVADLCKTGSPRMQKLAAAVLAKVKYSQGDQTLLDLAYHAVDKCMGMNGLLFAERSHLAKARDALKAAGAASSEEATVDSARNPEVTSPMVRPPAHEYGPGENSTVDTSRRPPAPASDGVLEMIAAVLGKRGVGHQALMDVAHNCIGRLTDGASCAADKVGARHSQETLRALAEAHDHSSRPAPMRRGGLYHRDGVGGDGIRHREGVGGGFGQDAGGRAGRESDVDQHPRRHRTAARPLSKRVEDIARTPLPPQTIARSVSAVSKQQDCGGSASGPSPDDLAAAFAKMSKEEQTLTLIKASYANPMGRRY